MDDTEALDTWCLMESDPVIFTELMRGIGVNGVQVEEVYSLDEFTLSLLPPIYAFIFLFKWDESTIHKEAPTTDEEALIQSGKAYFARQMIRNACATQAILNISMNLATQNQKELVGRGKNIADVTLSPELQAFRDFTLDFTPDMRGHALSNCDFIKACHHRFSGFADPDSKKNLQDEDQDSFHFVGILPIEDTFSSDRIHIVEMDGLSRYPKILATLSKSQYENDWVSVLCPILMARMNQCASDDIRFNLMAVTQDKLLYLQDKISKLEHSSQSLETCQAEKEALIEEMKAEKESRNKNSNLNLLREHNLLPAIQSLCQKYNF